MAGRPPKLTPEIQDRICELIRWGNYREVAAGACDIPDRTFSRWCTRGRKATSGMYFIFWRAILKAERDAEIEAVRQVRIEDKKWWLERKFNTRWGANSRYIRELERRLVELEKRLGQPGASGETTEATGEADEPGG